MATGGPQSRADYIAGLVEERVGQAGMWMTISARGSLRDLVEHGLARDEDAAMSDANALAERIVEGATQVAGLRPGDMMDRAALASIKEWFCPWSPWC